MVTIIHLTDEGLDYAVAARQFADADTWANEFCDSYVRHQLVDVSDFTGMYDTVAEYWFKSECDAILFKLRWFVG